MAPPTGAQLVAYMMTQRGAARGRVRENVNAYTEAYYGDRTSASWCLIFIWFCLDHFAAADLIGGKIAYVPNLKSRAGMKWRKPGQKSEIAQGDPVAFDFNRSGEPEHIGTFVEWLNSAHTIFKTIEGNTGNDEVAVKTRSWADVFGFVKPGLASSADPSKYPGKVYKYSKGRPLMSDSHTLWIQKQLTRHGRKVAADSAYGPDTAAKVKLFQADASLTKDGQVGPLTWAALAK